MVLPSEIANKYKREQVYRKQKTEKAKEKREIRKQRKKEEDENPELKKQRLANALTKTIENTRAHDETFVGFDPELLADEAVDEFASYFLHGKEPKVCITTSIHAKKNTLTFATHFTSLFPSAEFRKRGGFTINQIAEFCSKRDYTDLIVINEDRKMPNAITMIHLPSGPSAYFKLSSIKLPSSLPNHGIATAHHPELILNNFATRLGHTVGRFFGSLFPSQPEFIARQVVTFHNQRDYIFVRRHRYVFEKEGKTSERGKSKDIKVKMQELGPRFTLKLKSLQKGIWNGIDGEWEWVFKESEMGGRKRFYL